MAMDGFTVISSCFGVITVAVTFALVIQINFRPSQIQPHGAVATDDQICSQIGVDILKDGGNSVDAAISSLICLCVTHPHLVGPGGGGVMLIHDHKLNLTHVLDFMTAFPRNFSHPMEQIHLNDDRSIGVPGFLKGLESAYSLYGTRAVSWKKLFQPAIDLARHGFPLSKHLSEELHLTDNSKFSNNFKNDFFARGLFPQTGTVITRNKFAEFLEKVSTFGSEEFYLLTYGSEVIDAMRNAGSKISVHDFHNYEVKERPYLHKNVRNKTVLTVGPPFGGAQVLAGLSLLETTNVDPSTPSNKFYNALSQGLLYGASAIKNIFDSGIGEANLTVPSFVEELNFSPEMNYEQIGSVIPEFPASQVSVVDTQDLYVTVVAGLGSSFGSEVMTEHDIILNNHLAQLPPHQHRDEMEDDFGRPYSSYTPLIIMDSKNVCGKRVVLSAGSSGAVFQVSAQVLFRSLDVAPAIIEPRLTLGAKPNVLLVDDFDTEGKRLSSDVREFLKSKNFDLQGLFEPLGVNGVSKFGDSIQCHSDSRSGGIAVRIHDHSEL